MDEETLNEELEPVIEFQNVDSPNPDENDSQSSCNHSDFYPDGSLLMIETKSNVVGENSIEVDMPVVYSALCPYCMEFATEPAFTQEEVRMRVRYSADDGEYSTPWNA